MVEIHFDKKFTLIFSNLDNFTKKKVVKQIKKISENPGIGKPMRNIRKSTRELYVRPFRLSYEYLKDKKLIYVLDLYHKKKQ